MTIRLSMQTKVLLGYQPVFRVTMRRGELVAVLPTLRTRAEWQRLSDVWTAKGYEVTAKIADLVEPEAA